MTCSLLNDTFKYAVNPSGIFMSESFAQAIASGHSISRPKLELCGMIRQG